MLRFRLLIGLYTHTGSGMQIRLLGPIDVVVRGEPRLVHGLRRKAVLAVLALHGGGVVSTGQLTDAVWGDAAPPTAANSLQNHMSYLRGVLGAKTAILARPPGYVLQLPSDGTDVQVAERLLEQGTQSADPVGAVRYLRDALALWRGRALADVADLAWLSAQAERLEQLRLRAARELAEARLALGGHAHLLPELEVLVKEHPFDERLHAQLMLALYRSGRQVDALAVYRNLRRVLTDELGIEPGPPLRDLEAAILRQDRTLDLAREAAAPPAVAPAQATISSPVPAAPVQASAAPALDPLEREMSLASLNEYAGQARGGEGRLVLIGGEAGVGKSALVERLQRDLPQARWSWGMCDGLFTPRPLGPLFDLADQLGGGLLERCAARRRP